MAFQKVSHGVQVQNKMLNTPFPQNPQMFKYAYTFVCAHAHVLVGVNFLYTLLGPGAEHRL